VSDIDRDSGKFSASLLGATVAPCLHRGVALGCLVGTFGALFGKGEEVDHPKNDITPFISVGVRGGADLSLGRIPSIRLYGEMARTITLTTLHLSGRRVWTTPPVTLGLGAAVLANFP
jgi:hypothetical protein